MHKKNSIINVPLLIGIVVSVAIHIAVLYSKDIYTPPKPTMEQGRTVVHLTLVPSLACQAEAASSLIGKPAEQAFLTAPIAEFPHQLVKETASVDSQEQDANLIEDKGVTAEAHPFKVINPTYPRISRRRGEEGTVTVSIEVLQSGKTGTVSLVKSSGHARLDEAALKTAKQTPFTPAKQFGRNIDSTTVLSFTFRLTDD